MSAKKITVVIRGSSFSSERYSEALRMSVGLTLAGDDVTVVFLDDGVLTPRDPAVALHVATLAELNKRLYADRESLAARGMGDTDPPVAALDRAGIGAVIAGSDVVIPWPA